MNLAEEKANNGKGRKAEGEKVGEFFNLWQGSLLPPATITVSNWPYLLKKSRLKKQNSVIIHPFNLVYHFTHMCSLATKVCASLALSLLPLKARRFCEED